MKRRDIAIKKANAELEAKKLKEVKEKEKARQQNEEKEREEMDRIMYDIDNGDEQQVKIALLKKVQKFQLYLTPSIRTLSILTLTLPNSPQQKGRETIDSKSKERNEK